jgi:hypothetical protein
MSDPERLLKGGGTKFERELLGSLANEQPSRTLSRRMRQGLVALGVLTGAKTGVAGIVAIVGLLSVGAGGAWLAQHQRAVAPPRPVASVPSLARASVARAPAAAPAAPSATSIEAPAALAPRQSAAPSSSPLGDVREQIAWLDRARSAVRRGDSRTALAELAQYRAKFPRGEFAQEVAVLKIEALVQDGQMPAARSLAKKFLASHPESPHVERIERLLGTAR